MRTAPRITLNARERATLSGWTHGRSAGPRLARRARIILLAAQGLLNQEIAQRLGTDPQTVGRWRNRFAVQRLAGIKQDAPRSGRTRRVRERYESQILRRLRRAAAGNASLSTRALARKLGVNHMLVYRIRKEHAESSTEG